MTRCASCGFDNEPQALFCVNCGGGLASDPAPAEATSEPEHAQCPRCGHENPTSYRFCTECGSPLAAAPDVGGVAPPPSGSMAPTRPDNPVMEPEPAPREGPSKTVRFKAAPDLEQAQVTHLVSGDEMERHRFEKEFVIGRTSGDLEIPDDAYLSGRHVAVRWKGDAWVLDDLGSTNGTFVRVRDARALADGDELLLGRQLLRFAAGPGTPGADLAAIPNATRALGFGDARPRLVRVLEGGRDGEAYALGGDRTVIGRDTGDIRFEDDGLLSSAHATIVRSELDGADMFWIHDEGSRNGVFIRIRGEWQLEEGEVFTAGKQIFRFDRAAAAPGSGKLTVRLDLDPTTVP